MCYALYRAREAVTRNRGAETLDGDGWYRMIYDPMGQRNRENFQVCRHCPFGNCPAKTGDGARRQVYIESASVSSREETPLAVGEASRGDVSQMRESYAF